MFAEIHPTLEISEVSSTSVDVWKNSQVQTEFQKAYSNVVRIRDAICNLKHENLCSLQLQDCCVLLKFPRSAQLAVHTFACAKAYVPFYLLDQESLAIHRLLESQVHCLCIISNHGTRIVHPLLNDTMNTAGAVPTADFTAHDVLYFMFTSGSTAVPKCVAGSRSGTVQRLQAMATATRYTESCCYLWRCPLVFVDTIGEALMPMVLVSPQQMSSSLCCYPYPTQGGRLCCVLNDSSPPAELAAIIAQERVTHLTLVPTLLKALAAAAGELLAVSHLACVVSSGEVLTGSTAARVQAALPPQCQLLNVYGCTETSGDSSYFVVPRALPLLEETIGPLPIGAPLGTVQIKLRGDAIVVAGGLACGYQPRRICSWHEAEAQGTGFIEENGRQLFYTGDIGEWVQTATGQRCLRVIGRRQGRGFLKVRGVRLSPQQVECVAAGALPLFSLCVVVLPTPAGEVCAIALERSAPADSEAIATAALEQHINAPTAAAVTFVRLPVLPATASGKIDRRAVIQLLQRSTTRDTDAVASSEAQELLERAIVEEIATLLPSVEDGNGATGITADAHFFLCGGDSALALVLLHRVNKWCEANGFSWRATYDQLLANPTPRALSAALASGGGAVRRSASPVQLSTNALPQNVTADQSCALVAPAAVLVRVEVYSSGGEPYSFVFDPHSPHTINCEALRPVTVDPFALRQQHIAWQFNCHKCIDAAPLILVEKRRDAHAAAEPTAVKCIVGSHAGLVTCVNSSGGLVWRSELPDRVEGSAAYHPPTHTVVVGCYDHCLYSLCCDCGAVTAAFATADIVKCSPVWDHAHGLLWFGSYDRRLYALQLYKQPKAHQPCACAFMVAVSVDAGGSIVAPPLLLRASSDAYAFSAATSGAVSCFAYETKQSKATLWECWRAILPSPIFGSMCMSANGEQLVAACAGGQVISLRASDGQQLWQADLPAMSFSGLTRLTNIAGGNTSQREVFVCGAHDGHIRCFSCSDGELLWCAQLSKEPLYGRLCAALAPSGELFCIGFGTDGTCACVDTNGTIIATSSPLRACSAKTFSSPVVFPGGIAIGSRDDFLYCLRCE